MASKLIIICIAIGVILLPLIYKLPIPADTIPGLYYPMKDLSFGYSNGVPVENPLITDPVRQQFVWKWLAISEMKKGNWPVWNPYNFSGTPLLANFQSGVFYPGNIVFFLPNLGGQSDLHHFAILWSWYIYLQIPLSIFFLYLYLKKIGLGELASLYGGILWAFSGFSAAWWEWGNVVHTLLYFPLMLWSLENLIEREPIDIKDNKAVKKSLWHPFVSINRYKLILVFALSSSFFAGHLQTFILVVTNVFFYVLYKIPVITLRKNKLNLESSHRRLYYWMQLVQVAIIVGLISAIQFMPTVDFISKSARNIDTSGWLRKDWFYPIEHLVTFIAPDYFGNPSTYNYWGVWNYGEFAAYIGIFPLIFALAVIIQFVYDQLRKLVPTMSFRLSHKEISGETLDILQENAGVGFFLVALLINITLITRNILTTTLYSLNIPFFTSTQPSRGIAIVTFSLIILSAVGFHKTIRILRTKVSSTSFVSIKTNINFAYICVGIALGFVWFNVISRQDWFLGVLDKEPDIDVFKIARNNLVLPTLFFIVAFICLRYYYKTIEKEYIKGTQKVQTRAAYVIIGIMLTFTVLDIGRFFLKFESFSKKEYLYPQVNILEILQKDSSEKYMTEDSRILAPNMNIGYRLRSVEGYDPLYLNDYGKFIGLWQRNEPNLEPFNANRIITPHTPKSVIADIAATKYLLAIGEYTKYEKIGESGMTKLYKRDTALPRFSLVSSLREFSSEQDLANYMFSNSFDPKKEVLAISSTNSNLPKEGTVVHKGNTHSEIQVISDEPSQVKLKVNAKDAPGILYIADAFEEGWQAHVDNKQIPLVKTNITFRGLEVPQGIHEITLKYEPVALKYGLQATVAGLTYMCILLVVSIKSKR